MKKFDLCLTVALAIGVAFTASGALAQTPASAPGQPQQAGAPAAAPSDLGPQQIVEESAKRMLQELDAHRDTYAKDPAKLESLVANVLLPNFDVDYAARLVLGQAWRNANEEQRQRFVKAFYHSLLQNYGNALVNFTAGNFKVLPYKGDPGETQATVRTEVKKSDGERVPVVFVLHKTDQGWKAWDVVIEGISYVKSSRPISPRKSSRKGWTS